MPSPQTAPVVSGDFNSLFMPPAQAQPIFDQARKVSVAQRLFRQIELGDTGVAVPYSATKPVANWVAEGAKKPTGAGTVGLETILPNKLAAITVVSEEVVRKNPARFVDSIQPDLAEAFAVAFDWAAFHGLGGDGTGTGPFPNNLSSTTAAVEIGTGANIYQDFVTVLSTLRAAGKRLTGWALDGVLEAPLYSAADSTGRPLFYNTLNGDRQVPMSMDTRQIIEGAILNRPALMADNVGTANNTTRVGYAGDFTQGAWGVVGGIEFSVSTQATVTLNGTLVSLWEQNLVAIRAEAWYGFRLHDTASFVELTNAV